MFFLLVFYYYNLSGACRFLFFSIVFDLEFLNKTYILVRFRVQFRSD